jgi:peptidoglycan LD-endopeptidase LytH
MIKKNIVQISISMLVVLVLVVAYYLFRYPGEYIGRTGRSSRVMTWIRNPLEHTEWMIDVGERCGEAVFIFPTDGYVGFIWDDSFRPGHRHQGIDIFSAEQAGETPVISVYDGYLTRMLDWKSTVIIRIPEDPLVPGRQIWTYYTHMADEMGNSFISQEFPPETYEAWIPAGTILGYQGNYSGNVGDPTGIHLHFSIVRDDGKGAFLNELDISNTIDPSPYFKLNLNAHNNSGEIPLCN